MNLVTGESQMEKPDEDEDEEEEDEEGTDGEGKSERDEKTTPEVEADVGVGDCDSHFKNGDRDLIRGEKKALVASSFYCAVFE